MRGAYLSVLLAAPLWAAADASAGRELFAGKGGCLRCHSIENRGGSLGPDLTEIGIRRTRESLRLALTDPDAEIFKDYLTAVAVTRDGRRVEGVALNEDDLSIQLRDAEGNPRSLLKENLREVRREERSLMPRAALSPAEIDHVVAYLRTLKGELATVSRTRQRASVSEPLAWLTRPERDSDERPDTLLDSLRLPPGAVVADIGTGTGYYTWRLAKRVGPSGKVIAVDVQQSMLDRVAGELARRNLGNVELVHGTESDPRLPAGALDLVLIANSYHEFGEPAATLASVRAALKPGGRLVVVEYAKEEAPAGISEPHTMTLEEIRGEIEPAGFELELVLDFLPIQHGLIFRKRM